MSLLFNCSWERRSDDLKTKTKNKLKNLPEAGPGPCLKVVVIDGSDGGKEEDDGQDTNHTLTAINTGFFFLFFKEIKKREKTDKKKMEK